jgi:predicted PurR-regulated permease PerM
LKETSTVLNQLIPIYTWFVERLSGALSGHSDDERGISVIIEILAACLLLILVYAAVTPKVRDGVGNVIDDMFSKLTGGT